MARATDAPRVAALRQRHQIVRALRAHFDEAGFVEVETPSFGVCPGLDPWVHSLGRVDFHGRPPSSAAHERYLMTSPELFLKRLLAQGLGPCYQLARAYRAEELGALHEPEFTLLEWYRVGEPVDAVLADTEAVVVAAARAVRPDETPHLWLPARDGSPARPVPAEPPFERRTVREVFREFAGVQDAVDLAATDPDGYFQLLVDRVEPGLLRVERPVFLTRFPASQAALAQLCPDDPETAERFELTVGGVELCNGYDELTDPGEQRRRFERERERRRAAGEPVYPLDEKFLAALAKMPSAVGNALGVDRLVQLALGAPRLRDVMAFAFDEA